MMSERYPTHLNEAIGPLITVIIPVYKVEAYLATCVESVLCQSYQNLEIWLVDDGSPDACGALCDDFAQRDRRVKVIHQQNGGLSAARNAALDKMTGEYVTFVDSDDLVRPQYVEMLYRLICRYGTKLAVCGMTTFDEMDAIPPDRKKPDEAVFQTETALEHMLYQKFDVSAPYKLYSTALFSDIRYPIGEVYEDLSTTYKLLLMCDAVAYTNARLYLYRQRRGSIRHSAFDRREMVAITSLQTMRRAILEKYPALTRAMDCRSLSMTFQLFLKITPSSFPDLHDALWQEIKRLRANVLYDRAARKKARAAALISYFGTGLCRAVFSLLR
ncbi:glycosyltransferase family 2 protein [Oscillospiraceae bacterium CM]|nr:glycosyltransferase family 2 protein [Oscillospiraceae bacterium CM]